MLKWFIIIFLVFLIYFVLSNKTYASSPYTEEYSDPYAAFTENYGVIQRDFILRLNNAYKKGNISEEYYTTLIDRLTSGVYLPYFMYGTSSSAYDNASPQSFDVISLYLIPRSYYNAVQKNADWFGISGISQYTITNSTNTSSANAIRYRFTRNSINVTFLNGSDGWTIYAPAMYLEYIDPFVDDYLSQVIQNGEVNDVLVDILSMCTSINGHTSDTAENTEDIKDFLSNPNANDSSFNRTPIQTPTEDVSSNVDTIFYMFQDAFRC